MSSTAKEKLQIALQMVENHLLTLTHADDREGYIGGIREVLMLHNKAGKGSKYTKHASAIDGR